MPLLTRCVETQETHAESPPKPAPTQTEVLTHAATAASLQGASMTTCFGTLRLIFVFISAPQHNEASSALKIWDF